MFVTGWRVAADGSGGYATVAYNGLTGAQVWSRRHEGVGVGDGQAHALVLSPDGSTLFVTGLTVGATPDPWDYGTIAYDAGTGATRWVARFDGAGHNADQAQAIGISPDGRTVFVTGTSYIDTRSEYDFTTIAYDSQTGAIRWLRRYDDPAGMSDAASRLVVSPDGARVYVTGWSDSGGYGRDYATIAYAAADGHELWTKRYDDSASGDDIPLALAVSPDGSRLFVTGASDHGPSTDEDFLTVAYDAASGSKLWTRRYNGPAGGADSSDAIQVSPDSSTVFVTGASATGPGSSAYTTIAYAAATGNRRWLRRYPHDPQAPEGAFALTVAPDGTTVYVTGQTALDYGTLAYDSQNGTQLWIRQYQGPSGNSTAHALTITNDGSTLYVTGTSGNTHGETDYATVAYQARWRDTGTPPVYADEIVLGNKT